CTSDCHAFFSEGSGYTIHFFYRSQRSLPNQKLSTFFRHSAFSLMKPRIIPQWRRPSYYLLPTTYYLVFRPAILVASSMPAKKSVSTIAISTGGGDCPGLNAVIRAAVKSAVLKHSW